MESRGVARRSRSKSTCPNRRWFYLAMGKAKTGHLKESKDAIRKLLDLDPDWRLKVLEDPAFELMWNSFIASPREDSARDDCNGNEVYDA